MVGELILLQEVWFMGGALVEWCTQVQDFSSSDIKYKIQLTMLDQYHGLLEKKENMVVPST